VQTQNKELLRNSGRNYDACFNSAG